MKRIIFSFILLVLFVFSSCSDQQESKVTFPMGAYSDEVQSHLGRGMVSCQYDSDHVSLSWRLLPEDPKGISFDIYRKGIGEGNERYKWVARTSKTSYMYRDTRAKHSTYAVRPSGEGMEGKFSQDSILLSPVRGKTGALVFHVGQNYKQARVVTGDLNGDGEREVVIAYSADRNIDPDKEGHAWSKSEDTVKVSAFLPNGERLWTMDLGQGIESGPTYQPMVVWDLDGDGKDEVILKTNKSSDPSDFSGERITVLEGMTGRVKNETKFPSVKGPGTDYNNDSRNYLSIAHLDGKNPYLIVVRGLYKIQKIWALDKNLKQVWERNLGLDHYYPSGLADRIVKFWNIDDKMQWILSRIKMKPIVDKSRGSHGLPISDVNEDGKEEILWGERCIGVKGKDLWAIKENNLYKGHPDIVFAAHILPSHKGKQIFYGREGWAEEKGKIGVFLADDQGNLLWANWGYNHIDQGWVSKIIPSQDGMQCFALNIAEKEWSKAGMKYLEPTGFLWGADGKLIRNTPISWSNSFPVDWDGDGVREILTIMDGEVRKYDGPVMEKLSAGCLWGADLFGDHREEVVAAPGDGNIYVFFNTIVFGSSPRVTPMADRQYKNDLSRTATHARVIPLEGGYIPNKAR